jgi:hypothetical protein
LGLRCTKHRQFASGSLCVDEVMAGRLAGAKRVLLGALRSEERAVRPRQLAVGALPGPIAERTGQVRTDRLALCFAHQRFGFRSLLLAAPDRIVRCMELALRSLNVGPRLQGGDLLAPVRTD